MVHGFYYEREAVGPVIAAPGQKTDAHGIAPGHEPVAVVLDFVNPIRARRRLVGGRWQAGFDEGALWRRGTHTQRSAHNIIAITTPIVITRGGNTQTASTGHQTVSQPDPDPVGQLSFAAVRRKLNEDMAPGT
jgi:hypothetical protein